MAYKGWEPNDNTIEAYLAVCRQAVNDEATFSRFKSLPAYQAILEHISPAQGQAYLDLAWSMNKELLVDNVSHFQENDIIGQPNTHQYTVGRFSPTTIRYIKNTFDIISLAPTAKRFTEIGGGYGGSFKTLSVVQDIENYAIIDLPDVAALQSKYLGQFSDLPPWSCMSCDDYSVQNPDVVISNYALSECDLATQSRYYEDVVSQAKMAVYITYNRIAADTYYFEQLCEKLSESFNCTFSPDLPEWPHNVVIKGVRK